ncbi:RIP metalloprotease RseP [bacterium]|nr:RIP metalloprotease RseP [bacterium]
MIITIFATIVLLGVLIFIHELGHFLAAKFRGVRVLKFSLGLPPTLISKKIGETEYCISLIPFGGYVKLAGEELGEEKGDEPWMLSSKKTWERLLVMAAGSFMNLLLGFALIWGIFFFRGLPEPNYEYAIVGTVLEESPAADLGLQPKDRIISIDGLPVKSWNDMVELIHSKPEQTLFLEWQRGEDVFAESVKTMAGTVPSEDSSQQVGLIGISPEVIFQKLPFFKAFYQAGQTTGEMLTMMFQFLGSALRGRVSLDDVGGPVLIAQVAGQTARAGLISFLFFMAALSINLALINMLPIPILDGGRILILLVEAVNRKPLKFKTRMIVQQIGLLIIVVLTLFITVNDIFRIFR